MQVSMYVADSKRLTHAGAKQMIDTAVANAAADGWATARKLLRWRAARLIRDSLGWVDPNR